MQLQGMAFIVRRTTKTGAISTALVESYRGPDGKPHHRWLANLRGSETLQAALGRLAAERDRLRKERAGIEPELPLAEKFYEAIMTNIRTGHRYSADELKEIDKLMRQRKRLLKRVAEIDAELARIQTEGVTIKKHCAATAEAIRAEAEKHAKHLDDLEALKLGMKFHEHMMLNEFAKGKE
jgi:chromosome segregation ATPase